MWQSFTIEKEIFFTEAQRGIIISAKHSFNRKCFRTALDSPRIEENRRKTKTKDGKTAPRGPQKGLLTRTDCGLSSCPSTISCGCRNSLYLSGKSGKKSIDNRPPFSYNPKCTAKSSASLNNTDRQAIWQSPATHGEVLKWLKRRPC